MGDDGGESLGDPVSVGTALATFWSLFALNLIVVVLRIVTRLFIIRARLQADDILVVIVLFLLAGGLICMSYIVSHQGKFAPGASIEFTPSFFALITRLLKISFGLIHFYQLVLALLKCAYLIMYYRIVAHIQTVYRVVLWCIAVYVVVGFVAAELAAFLYCLPVQRNWSPHNLCTTFYSYPIVSFYFAHNFSSDFFIIVFPLFLLPNLRLPRRELGIFFLVILLGSVTLVASTIRYTMIAQSSENFKKQSQLGSLISMWSAVEITAGSVANCLPTFRLFLTRRVTKAKIGSRDGEGAEGAEERGPSRRPSCVPPPDDVVMLEGAEVVLPKVEVEMKVGRWGGEGGIVFGGELGREEMEAINAGISR